MAQLLARVSRLLDFLAGNGNEGNRLLGGRFEKALQRACELHGSQVRKGTNIPYVSHLLAVTSLVLEDGGDEDQAIAALLHDAVKDQGGRATLDRIRSEFGDRVASIVEACSDTDIQPAPVARTKGKLSAASGRGDSS